MIRSTLIGCALLALLFWAGWSAGDEGPVAPETVTLGDVAFPHALHVDALEVPCNQCHHETDAGELDFPHPEFFADLWIDCRQCHHAERSAGAIQVCSDCHRTNPFDIADETLSAKVVIHRSCWSCHDVGSGPRASRSCADCHRDKRTTRS